MMTLTHSVMGALQSPRHARACSQACAGCINLPARASTSFFTAAKQDVDGRDKPGHDVDRGCLTYHPSHSEICGGYGLAGEARRRTGERNTAFLQAIDLLHRLEGLHDVLLDDDQRKSFGEDRGQPRIDLTHDDRGEPKADLVAKEKLRVRHQGTADRGHLLLAARERRTRGGAPLSEHREEI